MSPPPLACPFISHCLLRFSAPDALLVVCGDHFGLIVDRAPGLMVAGSGSGGTSSSSSGGGVVGAVDEAIARGDREKAVALLSLEASHGRVSAQDGKASVLSFSSPSVS